MDVQVNRDEEWITVNPCEVRKSDKLRVVVVVSGTTVYSPTYTALTDAYQKEDGGWDFGINA